MKRCFDIVLAAVGLTMLAPLLAAIALAVALTDGRPVLYRQLRVGQFGVPFHIWKFRTMVNGAESLGGPLTMGDDRRITFLGQYLRKRKLDELPQLWNVLRGDMSFVGPRPEVPKYVALYTPEQQEVLNLKPGITDVASIQFRNESDQLGDAEDAHGTYISEIMPSKISFNLEYAKRSSVLRDLWVIARTLTCLRG